MKTYLQKTGIGFRSAAFYNVLLFTIVAFLCTQYFYPYDDIKKKFNVPTPISSFTCIIIIRSCRGRLGNKMFLFASAYGLARRHKCGLYIGSSLFQDLTKIFQIKLDNIIAEGEIASLRNITQRYTVCTFYPHLQRPNSVQYLELTGYWQTYKNFIEYADEIKKQFTFNMTIIQSAVRFFAFHLKNRSSGNQVEHLYKVLKNENEVNIQTTSKATIATSEWTWVGIHIRRTDILLQKVEASPTYIYAAMDFLRTRYSKTLFIIASDDKQYCEEQFGNVTDVIITSSSFSPSEDLAILSLCQHTIVTAGTFGWWAAFLAGGETLHDRKYLSKTLPTYNDCTKKDYYLPYFWVPIEHISNHLNESISPKNETYIFERVSV